MNSKQYIELRLTGFRGACFCVHQQCYSLTSCTLVLLKFAVIRGKVVMMCLYYGVCALVGYLGVGWAERVE